jgi:catechol 2,3-dioxygenase-like lactoylglutathione lyase family enzyme
MAPITHVRHIAVAVPRFEEAVGFYEGVGGLRRVGDDDGVVFLGTDAWPEQYILRLRRSRDGKRVDLISLAAPDAPAVDGLAERLTAAGTRLDREPGPLQTPGGGYGFRFFDPEGRLLEVSAGVAERPHRPLEPREAVPRRLSHIVLNSSDVRRTTSFYERFLGFRVSDWLGGRMSFLRCTTDHHSLAFVQRGVTGLNHVAFEMRGVDECMRGAGRLVRDGHEQVWGPGRHGAGDNVFAYFRDPNDTLMEYTCDMQQIPPDCAWEPRVWDDDSADTWGTAGPPDRFFALQAQPPDRGLWTPAPI